MELLGQCLERFRYVTNCHFLHESSQKSTLNYTLQTHYAKIYGLHILSKKYKLKEGCRIRYIKHNAFQFIH